jgi:hypothetical protein
MKNARRWTSYPRNATAGACSGLHTRMNFWAYCIVFEHSFSRDNMITDTDTTYVNCPITSTRSLEGRLCNHVIRNLGISIVAEKFNLCVEYGYAEEIAQLGIPLYSGTNRYPTTTEITDRNYFDIYNKPTHESNLHLGQTYFQTREITNFIYKHLRLPAVQTQIVSANPYKDLYNQNDDMFVHIRLTDTEQHNPGIHYYLNTISAIRHERLYIASDDQCHSFIRTICSTYPDAIVVNKDSVQTILFGSTCRHIVLSHGSYSAVIGYLGFYSAVHYPVYESGKMWYGDMFSIPNWYGHSRANENATSGACSGLRSI